MESQDLEQYFGYADFAVFFATLILAALIGMYFGYKDRHKKSIETYYFGDHHVSPVAVAMSMSVSFVSAITIIGFPVETYFYGITFLWNLVAIPLSAIISAVYFIPLIFRLKLKSIYEIIYMGVTVYLPALALDSVTPLDLKWTIALTSLLCTIYTALGGIKAVVWTDVLQTFVMVFGVVALLVKGTIDVGGMDTVWETSQLGGRLNYINFHKDIRERTNSMSYLIGYFLLAVNGECFTQVYAQRYLSCKSVDSARKATFVRLILTSLFMFLAALVGLVMYAYYAGCDPYEAGYVTKRDQLTPHFAVEILQTMPGLAGLFVAAAYSGTLSTVSSGINSLATIATEDFVHPRWPGMSVSRMTVIAKIFTLFFGCLVTSLAYAVSQLQSTVVQISVSLSTMFAGSVFALFLLGALCPLINSKGAMAGLFTGCSLPIWCSLGRIVYGPSPEFNQALPTSIEECFENSTASPAVNDIWNVTTNASVTNAIPKYRPPLADTLYSVSPFLYGFMGFVTATATMVIVSGITGFNNPKDVKPELFVPLIDNRRVFPGKVIDFFRFGVPEIPNEKSIEDIPLQDVVKSV